MLYVNEVFGVVVALENDEDLIIPAKIAEDLSEFCIKLCKEGCCSLDHELQIEECVELKVLLEKAMEHPALNEVLLPLSSKLNDYFKIEAIKELLACHLLHNEKGISNLDNISCNLNKAHIIVSYLKAARNNGSLHQGNCQEIFERICKQANSPEEVPSGPASPWLTAATSSSTNSPATDPGAP